MNLGLIDDFKDEGGGWAKTLNVEGSKFQTRSYSKWNGINKRCRVGKSYSGCTNNFKSFNDFVEWHRLQIGYDKFEWELDKDLLIKGNKVYSPSTCILLPYQINLALVNRKSGRGNYPIGVYKLKGKESYKSTCSDRGKTIHLGYYKTVDQAFKAYKDFKEKQLTDLANKWKGVIDERAYNALISYEVSKYD